MVKIGNSWDTLLKPFFESDEYQKLHGFLIQEYSKSVVYPCMHDIFNAFKHTDYHDVKALILGQDPYFNEGQAHGLCFSVKQGAIMPPSLKNIFKEMQTDVGKQIPKHGCLDYLAHQGVLMLNTVLTVRGGFPNSHKGRGWEILTDKVISLLNEREKPLVFLLWGKSAQSKLSLITNPAHLCILSAHPSPLSANKGFFGSKPFSKCNSFLQKTGIEQVCW